MKIYVGRFIYNVNQNPVCGSNGRPHWLVSFVADAPLVIDGVGLLGLARQLGLTEAEVAAVLNTKDFPPQLTAPDQPLTTKMGSQWLYRPAVAALLALRDGKFGGLIK